MKRIRIEITEECNQFSLDRYFAKIGIVSYHMVPKGKVSPDKRYINAEFSGDSYEEIMKLPGVIGVEPTNKMDI